MAIHFPLFPCPRKREARMCHFYLFSDRIPRPLDHLGCSNSWWQSATEVGRSRRGGITIHSPNPWKNECVWAWGGGYVSVRLLTAVCHNRNQRAEMGIISLKQRSKRTTYSLGRFRSHCLWMHFTGSQNKAGIIPRLGLPLWTGGQPCLLDPYLGCFSLDSCIFSHYCLGGLSGGRCMHQCLWVSPSYYVTIWITCMSQNKTCAGLLTVCV